MTCSKPCYFPFNVNWFFFCQSLCSATLIHSQSRMIKITFCSFSFRSTLISLILVSFWFILSYSVVVPPRSGIFWSIPVIPLYLCVIPPHSGVIPARSGMFRYHSCSFRFIPVLFRLLLAYSGIFRSVPFRSVPVFSNAPNQVPNLPTDRFHCQAIKINSKPYNGKGQECEIL